jgi:hypothetical protein
VLTQLGEGLRPDAVGEAGVLQELDRCGRQLAAVVSLLCTVWLPATRTVAVGIEPDLQATA